MLETCLGNKVIRDFLQHYKQSRWQKLIPSLIEIAILNLNSSFHTLFFSEEDIHNIIKELKGNQHKNNFGHGHKMKKERTHIIFSKPSHEWRTADGGVEPPKSRSFIHKDRDFLFDNYSISIHSTSKHSNHNNNRKKIKNAKSKIKEQVEMDKKIYYNKRYGDDDNYRKPLNQIEKINYAISYDKNLQPELIEKTTFNKNKKGRKKIIQKMTQEEYEQEYTNGNEDYEEGDNEEHYEQNYEEEEYYAPQDHNNFDNLDNNSFKKNNNRNNLYHYNKNLMMVNNLKQSNNSIKNVEENNSGEIMQNPQQSFNPKYYKESNSEQRGNDLNKERNNYINIENYSNEQPSPNIGYKYNPINYRGGISESEDKSSKLIGIEKKYQKKIDELEQNVLNDNKNNIDNYANKLQVNVTNMEEYKMKKGINSNNDENEEDENNYQYNNNIDEENQLSDNNSDMNDEGVLSQMSNMTERTKLLVKRTMDEYPPMEEDTFYDQNSLTK